MRAPERLALAWRALLLGFWASGFLILSFKSLAGVLRLRGIIGQSRPVKDPSLGALWIDLCSSMAVRKPARLAISTRVSVPLVTGMSRASVLLPTTAPNWPPPMLRAALVHELVHVLRNDLFSSAFARLVTSIYWFNPFAWYALHALQAEAEMAADDGVVTLESQPVKYAESLLTLVRTFRESKPSPAPAIGMLRRAGIETRLKRILDPSCRRLPPRRSIRLAALIGVPLLSGGLATFRPVAASSPSRLADPPAANAAVPSPFAVVPFRLEAEGGPYIVASIPPLLLLVEKKRLELGVPFDYKISKQAPDDYGMRLDFPLGPVRIDYGIPHYRDFNRWYPYGDFPGPGYREQKALPSNPTVSPHETNTTRIID
jgi:hypothetical protein